MAREACQFRYSPKGKTMSNSKVAAVIVKRLQETMEAGSCPWVKPWKMPVHMNGKSSRAYTGGNAFWLSILFSDKQPFWFTRKQFLELGLRVKKDEFRSSVPVAFWNVIEEKDATGKVTDKKFFSRFYTVWNIEQMEEGEKKEEVLAALIEKHTANNDNAIVEDAQAICDKYLADNDIELLEGNAAYYTPSKDTITMPPMKSFNGSNEYYATLFHEIAHSTGAEKRLNRKFGKMHQSKGEYAYEELVAEITASILCGIAGVTVDSLIENSASYIKGWASEIRNNPDAFMSAVNKAMKAVEMITGEVLETAEA